MNKGKLFVLSAHSGTGKTTILKTLLKNNPKWNFSVSAKNRAPREGEITFTCLMKNLTMLLNLVIF